MRVRSYRWGLHCQYCAKSYAKFLLFYRSYYRFISTNTMQRNKIHLLHLSSRPSWNKRTMVRGTLCAYRTFWAGRIDHCFHDNINLPRFPFFDQLILPASRENRRLVWIPCKGHHYIRYQASRIQRTVLDYGLLQICDPNVFNSKFIMNISKPI